jgi:hypothetical protein
MPTRPKTGLLLFFSGSSAPSVYTISGTVYDADGSTPVEGATVALGLLTATSAANGTYTISDVPAGASGSMTCTLAGYVWTAITVAAMSGNLTSQNYVNNWYAVAGLLANCILALQPRGAASLANSYINLANPGTYDAAPGVAPTLDATGWTFNGTTQYLLSNCPTNLKPCTYVARISTTNTTGNRTIIGCSDDNAFSFDLTGTTNAPRLVDMNVALIGAATTGFSAAADSVIAVSYSGAGVWTHYLNGSANGSGTTNRTPVSRTLMIGTQDTTLSQKYPGIIGALGVFDVVLTPTQVAALSAGMVNIP